MKNIYLLEAKREVGYDSYDGHVVIASTPKEARNLCPVGDEGAIWTDDEMSSCEKIGETEFEELKVVLSSFNAG